jgi:NADPH-dependent curcumin reductase CurA
LFGFSLELVFSNLAVGARIFLCGMVSQQTQYDSFEKCNLSNYALSELIYKRAKIQGIKHFE